MESDFANKVVIVTGGGEGIGLCIAQRFLEHGASVVIAERQADLKPKAEKFLNAGKRLLFSVTDVSMEAPVKAMVKRTLKKFGRIDYLVNNAGIIADQTPFEKLDYADWKDIIGSNLSASFLCAKHCRASLTHSLALSLAPKVRVNCISPGWIVTDAYQHGRQHTKLTKADHTQHPVGRVGQPEDIADMALYLCWDKAGYITGANFVIDGGMTIKMIYV